MTFIAQLKSATRFSLIILTCLWLIELVNFLMSHKLNSLGIHPRDLQTLWHIPLAPFIHGFPLHLVSNSLPLFILIILSYFHGYKNLITALVVIIFFSGLMIWLVGRSGVHLGASMLIFGLWGYLLGYGFYQRNLKSILLATITFVFYGGLFYQLLRFEIHISWEGHFFGAMGGLIAALILAKRQVKN